MSLIQISMEQVGIQSKKDNFIITDIYVQKSHNIIL